MLADIRRSLINPAGLLGADRSLDRAAGGGMLTAGPARVRLKEPALTPLPPTVARAWLPVALSRELKDRPIARRLAGVPLVLFRANGVAAAARDRCPHRNHPLSLGRVAGGLLECPYHGWRFAADGRCVEIPGLEGPAPQDPRLRAEMVAVRELHGAVFVRLSPEGPTEPNLPPLLGAPGHDRFWWTQPPWRGRAIDAVENVLDPYHTNFIHDGIIRERRRRQPVEVTITTEESGVEAVYAQDRPDRGWMSRALEGPRKRSSGRFYPPATVQARWEGPEGLTLCVTAFFTPETEGSFRPFSCFTTPRGRAPGWVKERLIRLFLDPVVTQDREALARQYEAMEAFGGPHFRQGPLDRLSARVMRLYQGEALEPGVEGPFRVML
jgi:phenylpropionate dioxygenase-like ring-hydroxylating dioxygenase large terminal subunit